MSAPIYDVDYFIAKFEAILEELWCIGDYENTQGQRCVMGHCGMNKLNGYDSTPESQALKKVLAPLAGDELQPAENINNGDSPFRQATPKLRILAALHEIKAKDSQ